MPEHHADNKSSPQPPAAPADGPPSATETTADQYDRRSSNWDIKNAPRNYVSLLATHGATAVFSFASVWLITRYLGAESYGSVIAIVAASQLIQIFLNWSSTALTRYGIEEFVETGRITKTFWSRTAVFIPNLVLVVLLSYWWLDPVSNWLTIPQDVLSLVVIHIIVTSVWLHVQGGLQSIKMLRLQGILLAIERCVTFTSLVLLFLFDQLSPFTALCCYVFPPVMLILVGIIRLRGFIAITEAFSYEHFRKILVFSIPLIPFAIVSYMSTSQLDAFFITKYLSVRDLGIYAIATQINGLTGQIAIIANGILLSLFVTVRADGTKYFGQSFFRYVLPAFTLAWTLLCLLVSLSAEVLIPIVLGVDFSEVGSPLFVLLSSAAVAFPVYFGLSSAAITNDKTNVVLSASLAAASSNVIFNLLLIPPFGLIGCATATLISGAVNLLLFYLMLRRLKIIKESWLLVSTLPAAIGGASIVCHENPILAFLITVILVGIVATLQRSSVLIASTLVWTKLRNDRSIQ